MVNTMSYLQENIFITILVHVYDNATIINTGTVLIFLLKKDVMLRWRQIVNIAQFSRHA